MDAYFYHVMEAYKVAKAAQQLLINELNPYERRDYAKYAIESCDMYMKAYPILKNEDKIATFEHALWVKGSYERELESLQNLPPYDYSALERQDQLIVTLEYMIATTMNMNSLLLHQSITKMFGVEKVAVGVIKSYKVLE